VLVASVLAFAAAGCALFSKGEVASRRYFNPDLPQVVSKVGNKRSGVELRLGRVSAGSYIEEKMVFRESNYEVGFYDDRLWTEKPEAYLRRALERVLYEEEGLRSVVSGAGPTLDVALISFEEVKPERIALVRVAFTLHDDRVAITQLTIAVRHPIAQTAPGEEANAVAEALGEGLRDAVYQVSGRVLADLANLPKRELPCAASNP
jgi:cholesterol transport system auxiliary component